MPASPGGTCSSGAWWTHSLFLLAAAILLTLPTHAGAFNTANGPDVTPIAGCRFLQSDRSSGSTSLGCKSSEMLISGGARCSRPISGEGNRGDNALNKAYPSTLQDYEANCFPSQPKDGESHATAADISALCCPLPQTGTAPVDPFQEFLNQASPPLPYFTSCYLVTETSKVVVNDHYSMLTCNSGDLAITGGAAAPTDDDVLVAESFFAGATYNELWTATSDRSDDGLGQPLKSSLVCCVINQALQTDYIRSYPQLPGVTSPVNPAAPSTVASEPASVTDTTQQGFLYVPTKTTSWYDPTNSPSTGTHLACQPKDFLIRTGMSCNTGYQTEISGTNKLWGVAWISFDSGTQVMSFDAACKGQDGDSGPNGIGYVDDSSFPRNIDSARCLRTHCIDIDVKNANPADRVHFGERRTITCPDNFSFEGTDDASLKLQGIARTTAITVTCLMSAQYDRPVPEACYPNIRTPTDGYIKTSFDANDATNIRNVMYKVICDGGLYPVVTGAGGTPNTDGFFQMTTSQRNVDVKCEQLALPTGHLAIEGVTAVSQYQYNIRWDNSGAQDQVNKLPADVQPLITYQVAVKLLSPAASAIDFTAAQSQGLPQRGLQIYNVDGAVTSTSSFTVVTDANSIVEHTTTSFGYRFTASQDTTVTADTESTFHWVQVDSVTDATALDLRANVTTRCGCDLITNADGIIALGNVTQDFATNQLVVSFIASSLCASSYSVQQVKADGQPTRLTPLKTPAAVSSLECESKMAVTQYILGSVEYGTYGYSHTWSVVALADLIADGSAAYYTPNPLDVDSKSFVPMFAFTTSGSVTTAVTAGSPGSSPVGGASIP